MLPYDLKSTYVEIFISILDLSASIGSEIRGKERRVGLEGKNL